MSTPEADPAFEELLEHLRTVRAVDFTGYKRPSLMRLVARRMAAVGLTDYRAYQDHLEVDPAEFRTLFDTLLINVTSFFRDPEAWEAMRTQALPDVLGELPDDAPLRVWSAACATGQEAYTWVVLLGEVLGRDALLRRVKVYATDVDEHALSVGRAARYPSDALSALDPELVERYFEPVEGDQLVVRAEYRALVVFGRHDLIQDAPISRIDLLSCRNALMYFNAETQGRVLERLAFSLADNGVLLLGRAEMLLTQGEAFSPLDLSQRLFVKTRRGMRALRSAYGPRGREGEAGLAQVVHAAFAHAPEPQLVLDSEGALSLLNESAVRHLGMDRDDVGRPFAELEVSRSPVELRRAVGTALDGGPLLLEGVRGEREGTAVTWDVHLVPLRGPVGMRLGVQVTFVDVTRYTALRDELTRAQGELETAYEELQSANEELETTNEELQSAIEELETTNEELQSTNEELETMNEELQSTNEELQTLNDELRERTGEVNQVNAFLESILSSLQGGVVVVDRDLVVRVWNDRAEGMWGLRAYEAQGRSLLALDVGLPLQPLRVLLAEVVAGLATQREAVVDARDRFGRTIECSISCTALLDASGSVSGAVVQMEERPGATG